MPWQILDTFCIQSSAESDFSREIFSLMQESMESKMSNEKREYDKTVYFSSQQCYKI